MTVVLVAGNVRERAQRTLQSVLEQKLNGQIAVLVYDRAFQPARDLPEFDHPSVTYQAADSRSTLGQLQKQAVFAVQTEFIAFIEEHVVVPPGWAEESLRLHAAGYTGVTGIFTPGNAHHHWARIGFLMTYGEYVLPRQGGPATDIPADNASFIRSKLLKSRKRPGTVFQYRRSVDPAFGGGWGKALPGGKYGPEAFQREFVLWTDGLRFSIGTRCTSATGRSSRNGRSAAEYCGSFRFRWCRLSER